MGFRILGVEDVWEFEGLGFGVKLRMLEVSELWVRGLGTTHES